MARTAPTTRNKGMTMCTCGETKTHQIARRITTDGIGVMLWSDGTVTGRFAALPGVPLLRPRTAAAVDAALRAGWLLMGEVELYELAQMPALYDACRWAAARDGLPGSVRARMYRDAPLRPVWTLIQADRDGRAVERFWRLPRIRWPGLAVWDRCGAALRYEVMVVDRQAPNTCRTTGCRFATLEQLGEYLRSVSAF